MHTIALLVLSLFFASSALAYDFTDLSDNGRAKLDKLVQAEVGETSGDVSYEYVKTLDYDLQPTSFIPVVYEWTVDIPSYPYRVSGYCKAIYYAFYGYASIEEDKSECYESVQLEDE